MSPTVTQGYIRNVFLNMSTVVYSELNPHTPSWYCKIIKQMRYLLFIKQLLLKTTQSSFF